MLTHHYIKSAVEEDGVEGLLEKPRKVPRIGNRMAPEIVAVGFRLFSRIPHSRP